MEFCKKVVVTITTWEYKADPILNKNELKQDFFVFFILKKKCMNDYYERHFVYKTNH